MQLAPGGNLREHLRGTAALPLDDALRMISQLTDAVQYLHYRHIIHRDLASRNCLLASTAPLHVLLGDFGRQYSTTLQTSTGK